MNRFLTLVVYAALAAIGLGLTMWFQALIPSHPQEKQLLINASLASFYGITCFLPLAIAMGQSYRHHGSIRPALKVIGYFLVIGLIWHALTTPDEEVDHG